MYVYVCSYACRCRCQSKVENIELIKIHVTVGEKKETKPKKNCLDYITPQQIAAVCIQKYNYKNKIIVTPFNAKKRKVIG